MNVKFTKSVSVDYHECRTDEINDKSYSRGTVLRDVALEKLSRNFSNIHFVNGDLALSVPNDSFVEC